MFVEPRCVINHKYSIGLDLRILQAFADAISYTEKKNMWVRKFATQIQVLVTDSCPKQ